MTLKSELSTWLTYMSDISAYLEKEPRPWMTPAAVDFLELNVRSTDRVIEFGGGGSSRWWAKRAQFTYTVDASPRWAPNIIREMAEHPDLLAKWSMLFVPCDWFSKPSNAKEYWTRNADHLDSTAVDRLENLYTHIPFHPDIIVVDGSVRPQCCIAAGKYSSRNAVRMIVVDNMETLEPIAEEAFSHLQRMDFPETDPALIPDHQNGQWCTSVFLDR